MSHNLTQVEIKRNAHESAASVLKRFTRKVQSAGIINKVKGMRYAERTASEYVKKKHALKGIARRTETARLQKLGKLPERGFRS